MFAKFNENTIMTITSIMDRQSKVDIASPCEPHQVVWSLTGDRVCCKFSNVVPGHHHGTN